MGGGSRGGEAISFIEAAEEGVEEVAEEAREAQAQVYIPAPPHYIKAGASITPLSQMQVVADFTEISRINYERPAETSRLARCRWWRILQRSPGSTMRGRQ